MAELLCALSFGSGLAFAERMEHGTNTAFVGIQLARALGLGADGLEAVFYGGLLKDAGCGACGAVLAPFFPDEQLVPVDRGAGVHRRRSQWREADPRRV